MGLPDLSPSQFAYLFCREVFLKRIEERAQRLAEDGYSVRAMETPHVFLILCPKRVNTYQVHALNQTCTCPFYVKQVHDEPLTHDGSIVPCKHLVGLKMLLRKTRERLLQADECEAYRLWAHTMAWQAIERLRQEDNPTTVVTTKKGEERHERSTLSRRAGARSDRR